MNKNERTIITAVLLGVTILLSVDVYNDYFDGVATWHLLLETLIAALALTGIFYLMKGRFILERSLKSERQYSDQLQAEAQKWKQVSDKYVKGLSREIDRQLDRWGLTKAEKEITFLLLKGFTNQEIAEIRNTSIKTVRSQTNAIYTKSGLSGRSELSAFFLEDLLLPNNKYT